MDIRIGTVGFPIVRSSVLAQVDIVELTEGYEIPPLKSTGRRWRAKTPQRVAYSLQLPRYLFETPSPNSSLPGDRDAYGGFRVSEENLGLWKRAMDFAEGVGAQTLVLKTPASFSPTKGNTEALCGFFAAVDRAGRQLVWEPSGIWEPRSAASFAGSLDVIVAVDPLRDEPPQGETAYFRLGPFAAMGTRLGTYDLERLADAAAPFETVTYVFETLRALDDARNLKTLFASG
jgi:uncharacterized protein YecE (DUF72 family)